MQAKEIGSRGMLLTFDDSISVYIIRGRRRDFLCDTHLGNLSMQAVKFHLREENAVVFNSHSDWDHVWGNGAFNASLLVAHRDCRRRLAERGHYELAALAEYRRGQVDLRLPELTFDSRLVFEDEAVEFFHAPGHTADSAVCHDREDGVLFAGDLVEAPIPYLDDEDLARYLQTLEKLRQFPVQEMISAHSGIVDRVLIEANMRYVEMMLEERPIPEEIYRGAEPVHRFNKNNRHLLVLERQVREKLNGGFDYGVFRRRFSDLHQVGETVIRQEIQQYRKQNGFD